jgi:hypothetical protein
MTIREVGNDSSGGEFFLWLMSSLGCKQPRLCIWNSFHPFGKRCQGDRNVDRNTPEVKFAFDLMEEAQQRFMVVNVQRC